MGKVENRCRVGRLKSEGNGNIHNYITLSKIREFFINNFPQYNKAKKVSTNFLAPSTT